MKKGTYKGSVEWNFGPFGKLNATKEFELGAAPKPIGIKPMLLRK